MAAAIGRAVRHATCGRSAKQRAESALPNSAHNAIYAGRHPNAFTKVAARIGHTAVATPTPANANANASPREAWKRPTTAATQYGSRDDSGGQRQQKT